MTIDDWKLAGGGMQGRNYFSASHPELVLKVYNANIPRKYVEYELACTKALKSCGFSCPKAYEIIDYEGGTGIISERILHKKSFCALASEDPSLTEELAVRLASMIKSLHSTSSEGKPFRSFLGHMQNLLDRNPWLDDSMRGKVQQAIDDVRPFDRNTLIHGDFQFGNVITDGTKDYFIDLGSLSYGNPDIDLSMFYFVTHFGSDEMCMHNYHMKVNAAFDFWTHFKKAYFGSDIPDAELFKTYRKYLIIRTMWIQYDTDNSAGSRQFMKFFSDEDCPHSFVSDSVTSSIMNK